MGHEMNKGGRDRSTGQGGASHASSDIRLTARDRSVVSSTSGSAKSASRKGVVDRDDDPPAPKASKRAEPKKDTSGKKRSRSAARRPVSWLGRLFYWSVVASIWGFIAVAGLVVMHYRETSVATVFGESQFRRLALASVTAALATAVTYSVMGSTSGTGLAVRTIFAASAGLLAFFFLFRHELRKSGIDTLVRGKV